MEEKQTFLKLNLKQNTSKKIADCENDQESMYKLSQSLMGKTTLLSLLIIFCNG